MRWLINLPRVLFELTDGSTQEMASGAIVTPKGGMNGDAFEQWLNESIYPMFPDLAPEWEYDDDGNVARGPAVLKNLTAAPGGSGRLAARGACARRSAVFSSSLACRTRRASTRRWATCTASSSSRAAP